MPRFHKYFIPVMCVLLGLYAIAASQPVDFGVELLVYDNDHWTEGLTASARSNRKVSQAEYDIRDRRGDIIEIHEWPFWTLPSHWSKKMEAAFSVVTVKGITVEQARAQLWGERDLSGRRARRIASAKVSEFETFQRVGDVDIRGPR